MTKEIRQKYEQLITECVHQRNVIRDIAEKKCDSATSFTWLYYMRFYYESTNEKVVEKLGVKMANGQFFYGFEYLGVAEKLV
jgi:dynein heavy chain 1